MAENVKITISALDKTKKGFGSATKGLKAVAGAVLNAKTAIVGLVGAAGFGALIVSSLRATDTLSKTAQKIGTTTEALGALRYAADLTGVSTQTMDMALQRFTRRTAEAAKGTGEAKGAIKELGLNARELNRMPLDERMIVLADAFQDVKSESDRLRLAFKLFDSEGAALVNTLSQGSDGLKAMLGEAKALGLAMSTNAASGVEDANDAITKLLSLGRGVRDQFTAALAPAIESVVTSLTEFFEAIAKDEGGVEKWAQGLAKGFLRSIATIVRSLDTGLTAMASFVSSADEFFGAFEKRAQTSRVDHLKKQISELGQEIVNLQKGGALSMADILLGRDLESKSRQFEDLVYQGILAEQKLQEMGKPIANNGLSEFFDETLAQIEKLQEAIGADSQGRNPLLGDTEENLNSVQQAFKDWKETVKDTDEIVRSFTTNALDGLTDSLTAGITGAANFADAMKSMAKSVVDSLIKMLVQKYIVDKAFGFITSSFGTGGSGSTGSGMTAGGGLGMGQDYSATAAIGGSVNRGQPTLVGERGQEVFVPNQNGAIIPNNKLGGGGGVVVNQTINVTTGVQQTVRAEIATLMPQIANAAKGAVADARMRGGGYSKALVGA
jgi:hypothetical protein